MSKNVLIYVQYLRTKLLLLLIAPLYWNINLYLLYLLYLRIYLLNLFTHFFPSYNNCKLEVSIGSQFNQF